MPPMDKGKKEYSEVVVLIPGPREPKNLDIYWEPLLEDLKLYGPAGETAAACIPMIFPCRTGIYPTACMMCCVQALGWK